MKTQELQNCTNGLEYMIWKSAGGIESNANWILGRTGKLTEGK